MQNVFRVRVDPSSVDRLVFSDFMETADTRRRPSIKDDRQKIPMYIPTKGKYAQVSV